MKVERNHCSIRLDFLKGLPLQYELQHQRFLCLCVFNTVIIKVVSTEFDCNYSQNIKNRFKLLSPSQHNFVPITVI